MVTMRLIGVRDYSIREDGQPIGRIRSRTSARQASGSGTSRSTSPARRSAAPPASTTQSAIQVGMAGVQGEARPGKAGEGLCRDEPAAITLEAR